MSRNKLFRALAPLMLAALMVGLSVVLLTTIAGARPEQSAAASPRGGFDDEYRNTLRIYGRCTKNASFPYADILAPFSIQHPENPPKDFVVWNPAYLYHMDTDSAGMYGNFFGEIKASGTNASEKVFLKQWYVPKYDEPSGLVWTEQPCVASPHIVKEYTYMLLDSLTNDPTFGLPGSTSFVFPTARRPADATLTLETYEDQFGLSDYNMNKYDNLATMVLNDKADVVRLETVGEVGTSTDPFWPETDDTTAFGCVAGLPLTAGNNITPTTPWIDISTGEFQIAEGDAIRFLDHKVVVKACTPSWLPGGGVKVDVYYTGNSDPGYPIGSLNVGPGETLSSGRHHARVQALTSSPPNPPSRSAEFVAGTSFLRLVQEPWYLQVLDVAEDSARIKVGRLLVEAETFFVNAAEYEIAKIHTVGCGVVKMSNEFLGIADGTTVTYTVQITNTCGLNYGKYFADCDGDGNVDENDVTVYVDDVIQDVSTFDIYTETGEVVFVDPPCCDYEVTIDYCYDSLAFKYITVRNGLPKYDDVELPYLSIVKHGFDEQELFPLLPPFNMLHDMVDDINIPDAFSFVDADGQHVSMPDVQLPDNQDDADDLDGATGDVGWGVIDNDDRATADDTLVFDHWAGTIPHFAWVEEADGFGDVTFLPFDYNTIAERLAEDVDPIVEWFEQEDKEERFDTNLLEEKFTEIIDSEEWRWKNIETRPWDYTELVLPELPDKPTETGYDYGDYILVSSFMTEDTPTFDLSGLAEWSPAAEPPSNWSIHIELPADASGIGGEVIVDVSDLGLTLKDISELTFREYLDYLGSGQFRATFCLWLDMNGDDDWDWTNDKQICFEAQDSPGAMDAWVLRDVNDPAQFLGFVLGTGAPYQSLADWQADATYKDQPVLFISAGAGWGQYDDYDGYVDDLTINGVTYDFQPIRMKFAFDAVLGKVNSADIYVNDDVYNQQYRDVSAPSLRVYGRCDENAAFPYDIITGSLSIQSPENPPKDFVVWNPAYLSHDDFGIVVEYSDANEKVHLRQWYVPKYQEPSGYVWEPQEPITSAHILKEYTYILLDANNDPMPGHPSKTNFVFPIADNDDAQTGLDDFDMNGDDQADLVHLETVGNVDSASGPPSASTLVWNPSAGAMANIPANTPWIDISTGPFMVYEGDVIRFLDHVAVVTAIAPTAPGPRVTVDIYYTGNADDEYVETVTIPYEQTASAGRKDAHVQALTNSPPLPPSQSDEFIAGTSRLKLVREPWYLQVRSVYVEDGEDAADIVVGRLLTEVESFFVDAAEYEVAKIGKVTTVVDDALKLITIRNGLPKYEDVNLHNLSIIKDAVEPGEYLPLLPPFNMEHDIVDDINIPDCKQGDSNWEEPGKYRYPDEQYPDNIGDPDVCTHICGSISGYLDDCYDTIAERVVEDVGAAVEYFIAEEKEERFDTNLLEEKFTEITSTTTITETWEWKNIETLPWDFTEFVLPPIPDVTADDPAVADKWKTGDYILVSSFLTEDSKDIWPNVGPDGAIRVKFVYDPIFSPDVKTGIYVNTPHECFCFGDFNGDDFRDGADLMLMVQAWNTSFGDEGYEARFDVDFDGDIDITDLMLVAAVWNTPCPAE